MHEDKEGEGGGGGGQKGVEGRAVDDGGRECRGVEGAWWWGESLGRGW